MHSHEFNKIPGSLRDYPNVGVLKCRICGLVAHEKDMKNAVSYESGTMHAWAESWGERRPPGQDFDRRCSAIFELIESVDNSHYLDVGCGTGEVVREVRTRGGEAYGFDPEITVEVQDLHDQGIILNDLSLISGNKFDVISLFHVIEHVYEPVSLFESLRGLLKPQGKIVIETPNANDALLQDYSCEAFAKFTFWSHHPFVHTNQSLNECLQDAGFSIEKSSQIQRYSLANHLFWLSKGERGGHEVWKENFKEGTESHYALDLVRRGVADTLWIVASVP